MAAGLGPQPIRVRPREAAGGPHVGADPLPGGDLLAVHTTREARNGQIVVARIGDEVTVKRFKREGSKVWLLAENPEFAPIEVNLKDQDLVIEGLSVGVIRR